MPSSLARLALCSVFTLISAVKAFADGGFPAEVAASRMVVPPGFHVEVFASEPMVRQPLSACFDERGRMWVIEYLQYPNPAGLKPVEVDQYLRTKYDKVPEPPPKGPKGADRIKILEDTDGDGKADKSTIFVEGLNLASGLAVGRGGVYVAQAPYLLFYPDRDRDDKPDSDPQVLLSGFGLEDAHATVNSLAFGPDGWLYGAQGSTVTANIRGIGFQQGIWRYHPVSNRFELFAEGGGNTWGLDWDSAGNAFGSSNGSYIAFHVVQGGYYVKGFAKHGPLHNPRTYGYFGPIAYRSNKVGGHVTPGGIIYKGDAYPDAYQGEFIGGNLLSNAVYRHDLSSEGSSFSGKHAGTLIDARDPWFRPIDLTVGPDGCIYVVDWYDKRASHLDPRDTWDKTNGRIYRVVYGERRKLKPFDLSKLSGDELVGLRTSKNDWQAAQAREILAVRRDKTLIPKLRSLLDTDRDETLALRDLWALNLSGGLDDATAERLLSHPVAGVRRWVIRLLGDDGRLTESQAATLRHLAETDPDPGVRSQLASSCARWDGARSFPILTALLNRSEDAKDPQIPLLLWWACEARLSALDRSVTGHRWWNWMTQPEFLRLPLVRSTVLERLTRWFASSIDDPAALRALARLLAGSKDGESLAKVLNGIEAGWEGRKLGVSAPELVRTLREVPENLGQSAARLRLLVRLGDPQASATALREVMNAQGVDKDRLALISTVGAGGTREALTTLLDLVRHDRSPAVRLQALTTLGGFANPEAADALVSGYAESPPAIKSRSLDLLVSRRAWASKMLDAMAARTIPSRDLTLGQVIQLTQLRDPALTARVEALWGKIPGPGSAEKVRRVAEVRGILPEGDKGSAGRGAAVFETACATCHKLFGKGESIGPDLTGSERANLDFLLTSLVDPSSFVRKEYLSQTVELLDGRVLTGLVVDENDKTLTIVDAKRIKTVVPLSAVEARKASAVSLMPEGLLDPLKDEQIRDLFRYLQSSGPPAH